MPYRSAEQRDYSILFQQNERQLTESPAECIQFWVCFPITNSAALGQSVEQSTDGLGLPPSLAAQVNLFLSGTPGHLAPSGALYVVEGGGNDARDALAAAAVSGNPSMVIASAAAAFASGIHAIVDQLQAAGAQQLIVWNTPNLSLAPAVTSPWPDAF